MDFILGCNYWASNAGADMWRDFDIACVRKDLKTLSENGVQCIRVFPNWRDFQSAEPVLHFAGRIPRMTQTGKVYAENPYYLDETMLERFAAFLDICEEYGIAVIVGLLTGYMSGRLYIPTALYGENVLTSSRAHYFEQLFIKGFVSRFKAHKAVWAWDLGNECNFMGVAGDRWQVGAWTAMISNAIRAADPTRQIISGMQGIEINGPWNFNDHKLYIDVLTTHPYPYWNENKDENMSLRTTLYPTLLSKYYGDLSGKPCLAEELGSMGPMVLSEEKAGEMLRINMFSLWASGAPGVMWWCAYDQTHLEAYPYSDQMCERELGMLDINNNPKPSLQAMHSFAEWMKTLDFTLPPAREDAVCIMTRDQDQWPVAYMTAILANMAGFNCRFADGDGALPESKLYLMPSACGNQVMYKSRYAELKKRVSEGADLYISLDTAIFSEFEALTGLKVLDSYCNAETVTATVDGEEFTFTRRRNMIAEPTTARVLAYDSLGRPLITENAYGKGRVIFLNAPFERKLFDMHHAFDGNACKLYRSLFGKYIANVPVKVQGEGLRLSCHEAEDGYYAVVLNHTGETKAFALELPTGYAVSKVYYGATDTVAPFDACVLKITK